MRGVEGCHGITGRAHQNKFELHLDVHKHERTYDPNTVFLLLI